MTPPNSARNASKNQLLILQVYLVLLILGGLLTIASLLRIPAESKNIAFFGLSSTRLMMVGGILVLILISTGLLVISWRRKPLFTQFQQYLVNKNSNDNCYRVSVLLCSLVLFGCVYMILLTPEITEPYTEAYFVRLTPLIAWLMVICLQTLITLPLLRYDFDLQKIKPKNRVFYQVFAVFGVLLLLWILIARTKLGLTPSDAGAGWNALGTPILETQAFFAWILALFYIGLALWGENHPEIWKRTLNIRLFRIDFLISIGLWLSALLLWNGIPLIANWFAAPPRAPNQAFYPNSDAYLYDTTGQTLLTGEGFKTENAPFAIRPLYALFLAGVHAIEGPDYEPVIWIQVSVLALIPVLLYWIALHIHNRISALIAAVLIIFRESNAIILGSSITTSHSKLLMADLPTTLGVMLLVLVFIRWLISPVQRLNNTLIAGGITGAFMLIRPEFVVLLPFLGFAALLEILREHRQLPASNSRESGTQKGDFKLWVKGVLLMILGTILFLLPWIWRNYQITGTIFLDSPHYRSDLFAQRYQEYETESEKQPTSIPDNPDQSEDPPILSDDPVENITLTPTPQIAYLPGENAENFAERMFNNALNYAVNNLGAVSYFISNHFLNSQVQSILYLPATYRLPDSLVGFLGHKNPATFLSQCCSADSYIRRLPFWFKWDGQLPRQSILPLALNLFFISVGLVSTWRQRKFIALLPLFASLGYTLINAIVRNSGGRYILPVDWAGLFYYSAGIAQLSIWGVNYFRESKLNDSVLGDNLTQSSMGKESSRNIFIPMTALIIFSLGLLLPLSENLVTPDFPGDLQITRQNQLFSSLNLPLESFIHENGSIVHGRALYPRFHKAEQGEAGTRRTPFSPLPFSRLDFYMVGPYNGGVVLAWNDPVVNFPNGVDALAIGCMSDEYFDALAVVIFDQDGNPIQTFLREPIPEPLSCPLSQ